MKMKSIVCPGCEGPSFVDTEKDTIVFCPYCGMRIVLKIPLLRMTVQTKSLTARKKRKESSEMDIKRAGSQFYGRLRVCEA